MRSFLQYLRHTPIGRRSGFAQSAGSVSHPRRDRGLVLHLLSSLLLGLAALWAVLTLATQDPYAPATGTSTAAIQEGVTPTGGEHSVAGSAASPYVAGHSPGSSGE